MYSSPSPPIHTGCGLILGRDGMVVVVTVSGPLSCTSQMSELSESAGFVQRMWPSWKTSNEKKRISWKSSITISWYVRLCMLGYARSAYARSAYARSSYKHIHTTHNSSSRSDEGLILEMLSSNSSWWLIYVINSIDNTNYPMQGLTGLQSSSWRRWPSQKPVGGCVMIKSSGKEENGFYPPCSSVVYHYLLIFGSSW